MTTPEQIAGLSAKMVMALTHPKRGGYAYGWTTIKTLEALDRRKLVKRVTSLGAFSSPLTAIDWPLTPLGLEVSAILEQQP